MASRKILLIEKPGNDWYPEKIVYHAYIDQGMAKSSSGNNVTPASKRVRSESQLGAKKSMESAWAQ